MEKGQEFSTGPPEKYKFPEKEQDSRAEHRHSDIEKNHRHVSKIRDQFTKNDLFHRIFWIDVKHIDRVESAANMVDTGCNSTEKYI